MSAWLLLFCAGVLAHNRTIFVHRRPCTGTEYVSAPSDDISCNEPELKPFEHAVTPNMLWCNASGCVTQFGEHYSLHSLECDGGRCEAVLHCRSILRMIQQTLALAVGSAATFLCCLPCTMNSLCGERRQRRAKRDRHKDL